MERIGVSAEEYRVDRGMAMLDEKFAGHDWLKRVNLDVLDMSHGLYCIVAQVWGMPFYRVLSSMGVWNCMSEEEARMYMFRHGLDAAPCEGEHEYYVRLTAAWKAAIEARRGAGHA